MKFTLEIELGNDAMQTYEDVREAIKHSFGWDTDALAVGNESSIRDLNGNRVGKWIVTEN